MGQTRTSPRNWCMSETLIRTRNSGSNFSGRGDTWSHKRRPQSVLQRNLLRVTGGGSAPHTVWDPLRQSNWPAKSNSKSKYMSHHAPATAHATPCATCRHVVSQHAKMTRLAQPLAKHSLVPKEKPGVIFLGSGNARQPLHPSCGFAWEVSGTGTLRSGSCAPTPLKECTVRHCGHSKLLLKSKP